MKSFFIRFIILMSLCFSFTALAFSQTTWYVDESNTTGPWNGSFENPFLIIQDGLDAASAGDIVVVMPGIYLDNIHFGNKTLTVKSSDGAEVTTIHGIPGGAAVTFDPPLPGLDPIRIIKGFIITT